MKAKIRPVHLARPARVYIRQSTLLQVHEHRESTERQYALVELARKLGWDVDGLHEARVLGPIAWNSLVPRVIAPWTDGRKVVRRTTYRWSWGRARPERRKALQ
jgi:hypothetical protein